MYTNLELTKYPRWWRYGLPRIDVWVKHTDLIAKWIKDFKLKPVADEFLVDITRPGIEMEMPEMKTRAAKPPFPRPIPFPGGLRIPHFHYKGQLFVMKEEQWAKVSKELMAEMRTKLAAVNTVSFEQMMDLSDAVNGI